MGATRLASGIVQQLFSGGVFPFYFPDARRVAPIRASVSSSTKRYHQAQAQNATSNGDDASHRKYAVMPYKYQCSLSKTLQMLSASSPTM